MTKRFDYDPRADFREPERKRRLTLEVFNLLAPDYDRINRPLSLWRDQAWKRALVAALPDLQAPVCLDLACGTGDLAFLLAQRYPAGSVIALDASPAMLAAARQRQSPANVQFVQADMARTGLPDGSVAIVTGGYALRNAADFDAALTEIARVLKPGGTAAFLEFARPAACWGSWLHVTLLRIWGGFCGLLFHGNPRIFTYIADSLMAQPDRVEMRRRLAAHGLEVTRVTRHFAGLLETTFVRK